MGYCDTTLAATINDATCGKAPAKGYEQLGLLIRREDIDTKTIEGSTITALTLKSSKSATKIYQHGQTPFTGSTTEAEVGTYDVHFNKTFQFVMLNGGKTTAEVVDTLASGEYVAIVTERDKQECRHRVLGLENGLVLSAAANDAYGDTYNGVLVTMTESGASSYALYLDDESLYTTIAGA